MFGVSTVGKGSVLSLSTGRGLVEQIVDADKINVIPHNTRRTIPRFFEDAMFSYE